MFRTGETIGSKQGNTYEILEYLGEGVTAEVYKARRTAVAGEAVSEAPIGAIVALKILREGLTDQIEQNFRDEAVTLRALYEAAGGEDPGVADFIPRRIENAALSEAATKRYIALEFISDPPLDKILLEGGPLEEQTGLTIASQMLRILHVLHTKLRKSYTDFQLQNIRWNADAQQIKVIDWNHVSLEGKQNTVEDLARMGAYLYQMLTGAGAALSGETLYRLEQRGGERWKALTLGAQNVIARSLHPNPERRYKTAAEFREAVDKHLARQRAELTSLRLDVLNVIRPIAQTSSEAGQVDLQELEQAQVLVDLLSRRDPTAYEVERSQQVIRDVVGEVSPAWQSGQQDYLLAAYREATAKWEAEAARIGRVDLWRWVMVARTAAELGKEVYTSPDVMPAVEGALADMKQGDRWKQAAETLQALSTRHPLPALKALTAEAIVQLAAEKARVAENGDQWATAAQAYTTMAKNLPSILYSDALQAAYGWNVDTLKQRARHFAAYAAESDEAHKLNEAIQNTLRSDFNRGLGDLQAKLAEDPDNPVLVAAASLVADERSPQEALDLLDVVQRWARLSEAQAEGLRRQWQDAYDRLLVERARQALADQNPHALQSNLAALRAAPPDLLADVDGWYRTAVASGSILTAAQLADMLGRWDTPEGAERRRADLSRLRASADKDSQDARQTLFNRITALRDKGDYYGANRAIEEARVYFADDRDLKKKLSVFEAQVEFERLLQESDARLRDRPDATNVAFAQAALSRAGEMVDQVSAFDKREKLQRELVRLQAMADRAENHLRAEGYLTTAEGWLDNDPPRYDVALADYQAAEQLLASNDVDPALRDRLHRVKKTLDQKRHHRNHYSLEMFLNESERFLEEGQVYGAEAMLDRAENLRTLLPSDVFDLTDEDRRLAENQKVLRQLRARQPIPAPGASPAQPKLKWWQRLFPWLTLGLMTLMLLLLLGLAFAGSRRLAPLADVPTQVAALNEGLGQVRGSVASLSLTMSTLAAPTATAPPVTPSPQPPPTLPPEEPTITPSPPTATPTPAPLGMGVTATSPSVVDLPTTFFDLPDLRLTAPPGWQFNLSGPDVQLLDAESKPWSITLRATLAHDPEAPPALIPIPRAVVTNEGAEAPEIDVVWSRDAESAPQGSGDYELVFVATNTGSQEERRGETLAITVRQPNPVTVAVNNRFADVRVQPIWDSAHNVGDPSLRAQSFEMLARTSAPCTIPDVCDRPDAYFLLVRPVGRRQTYWLGDQHTAEFEQEGWADWIAALPVIP
jgi:hypothetical protein